MSTAESLTGSCTCGDIKYKVNASPLFVHCCHCTWCQRESGAAFAVNALVETSNVEFLLGQPQRIEVATTSGKGQSILRCQKCQIAVSGHYGGLGDKVSFIRVGSLDQPNQVQPDIHIYTNAKQSWVTLPENVPATAGFYKFADIWPEDKLARLGNVLK
ncbi:MAG: hypothetical protein ACI8P9_002330 [Parasphingorhabdus sp.]|jgi:hypothetical protein